jgi:hypothetical protein
MVYALVTADAFSIQLLVRSRFSLAGRLLYGDWIGLCFSRHARSWCRWISLRIVPTSYFRANADAIVLTNRKPVQCACRKAASSCAGHVQQFGGASPPANLMEVKA